MPDIQKVTVQWLEDISTRLIQQNVDVSARGENAVRSWMRENHDALVVNDGENLEEKMLQAERNLNKIRSYFLTYTNRVRAEGVIPSMYPGIHYFFGEFWEVRVPRIFGSVPVHPFKMIDMPADLLNELWIDKDARMEYVRVYADSFDLAYSIEEVERKLAEFPLELIKSGDNHLRASASLLVQKRTNSKSLEDSRMAVEIFLKGLVAHVEGLNDVALRRTYGHSIERLIDQAIARGLTELTAVRQKLLELPDVSSRYEAPERTFGELWTTYRTALFVGTTVLRHIHGRDTRKAFGL